MADTLPGLGVGPDDDDEEFEVDDLDDLDEPEPQSGLGRGLAAIIPTLADLDTPAPSARRRTRRRGGVAALLGAPPTDPPVDEPSAAPESVAALAERARSAPSAPIGSDLVARESNADGSDLPEPASAGDRPAPAPAARTGTGHLASVADRPTPTRAPATAEPGPLEADPAGHAPEPVHVPAPSAVRKLRDDLVGALLDGLANTMALDLCAYLHEGPAEEPHLFLQSPSLDGIGPARAYALFDGVRRAIDRGGSEAEFGVAGFRGVSVATVGDGSRGLWAVGRPGAISGPEREVATRFCRSFGRAVHQLDGAAAPANTIARPVRVEAHQARDSVLAEVQVRIGDQIRPGHGRAATRVEAITRAVLVAAGHHATFRYASEVAHEGEHAAVVLLEGGDHAVALGSALSPEPGGVATARAALRALDGLTL